MSLQPPSAPGGEWILDSGASSHMGSGSGIPSFPLPPSYPSFTIVGDGSALPITGIGFASLPTTSRPLNLLDILISPSLIKNLVPVRAFTRDNSVFVEFDPYGFSVKDLATKTVLLRCDSTGDLYPFVRPRHCFTTSVTTDLWHQRLGHPGAVVLAKASSYYQLSFNKRPSTHCDACRLGKHTRLPFSSSTTNTSFAFELCHCDLWTSHVLSVSGYQYYLVILDDFTHYVWTFPIRHKSEVHRLLTAFYAYVRTQFFRTILALQTDNGCEFDNVANRVLFESHGTLLRLTCLYTSQQNGKAERILRTLNGGVRTLFIHAAMPPRWWAEVLATSTFLLNWRPCKPHLLTTPFELLHVRVCPTFPPPSRLWMFMLPQHSCHNPSQTFRLLRCLRFSRLPR
ncbi:Retrotransposon protein [Hordeum vulgare]|nr:Retrotransposon protein [Hordeum vulgare]